MSRFFEYGPGEVQEGYEPFDPTRKNIEANVGKVICYLLRRDYDARRGYFFPKYGRLESRKYSNIFLDEGQVIDARDLLECAIKIKG